MTTKTKTQIIAGIFALATAWLGYAYQQKSSSASDLASRNEAMVKSIADLKSKTDDLERKLQAKPANPLEDIKVIRKQINAMLALKVGALDKLRNTGNLTPEQRQRINELATELSGIDNQLGQVTSPQ